MSDLILRLRQVKSARQRGFYTIHEPDAMANEAADLIEARDAQIAALQAQRQAMHRRAQKAEGEAQRLRAWFALLARMVGDGIDGDYRRVRILTGLMHRGRKIQAPSVFTVIFQYVWNCGSMKVDTYKQQIAELEAQLAEARNAAVYTQSIEGEVLHILSRLSELDASHIWEAVGISRMQHNIDVVIRALGPANADAIRAMKGGA